MIETLLQAILEQIEQPKKDLEHNIRALLNETVSKMDLVSQAEIERQRTALNHANSRLDALLAHVEQLEKELQNKKKHHFTYFANTSMKIQSKFGGNKLMEMNLVKLPRILLHQGGY